MSSDFKYNPPTDPWLQIIHEDRDIVVLNKQSGLLSVPGRTHNDSALSRVIASKSNAYAVHRLDMDTSGLLIIALRRNAEKELHRQFRERLVDKSYVAVVEGVMKKQEGQIDLPLIRLRGLPPRSVVDHENGRTAQTKFRVLESKNGRTRLRLFPKTGRSHQLRVHLKEIGHTIVGDRFYEENPHPNIRLHLHAESLRFKHPFSGEDLEFNVKEDF